MTTRRYYSVRTGSHPTGGRVSFPLLQEMFLAAFKTMSEQGFFQEVLGYQCVDAGWVTGTAGSDLDAFFLRKLKKVGIWPLEVWIESFSEDELFDVIELLHDCASAGTSGRIHSYLDCGIHYDTFDQQAGRDHYRSVVNEILSEYKDGFVLSEAGEIVAEAPRGLEPLLEAELPPGTAVDVRRLAEAAKEKFRRRGASRSDRRDALRDLAGALEYVKAEAKKALKTPAEQKLFDLTFNLANNFGIRHHNQKQLADYDPIFQSWIFYYFLATLHAATRLIERASKEETTQE